jgi:hypothetical protein
MTEFEALISDCKKLPGTISGAAEAIAHFAMAITEESLQRDTSGRWRPPSHNFVTVKPQYERAHSLAVTLRGNPHEFEVGDRLKLGPDQNGYSAFRLEAPDQIADAFKYVNRAHVLFELGRTRDQKTPKTIG